MMDAPISANRLDGGRRLVLARDLWGFLVWCYDPRRDTCEYLRWEHLSRAEQCYATLFAEDWWGVRAFLPRPAAPTVLGRILPAETMLAARN